MFGRSTTFIKYILIAGAAALSLHAAEPENAEDWLYYSRGVGLKNDGIASRDRGKTAKALEYLFMAERSGRELGRVYNQISDCFLYLDDNAKSIEYARKAITENPQNAEPYNRIFSIYAGMNKNEDAAAVLEEYCAANPDSVDMRFALGEHYLKKMNDSKKSGESFKKILDMNNESPAGLYYREYACYYLGYMAFQGNNLNEALKYYETAYELNKSNLRTTYMLAMLYMEFLNLEKAEETASAYLSAFPENPVMNSIMGQVLYIQDKAPALHYLRAGTKDNSVYGIIARGLYLEMAKKDKEAMEALQNIERYNPYTLSYHLALANIYSRSGAADEMLNELLTSGVIAYKANLRGAAMRCFRKAAELDGSLAAAFYYLGRIHEDTGSYSLAVLNYKKANELKPSPDMMLHIGYVYGLNRNYIEAFKYFDMVIADQPNNAQPYFYHGIFSMQDMNYSAAEKNLLKAVELDNKHESYYFYLAITCEKRNKIKEAVSYLEKALERSPESARVNNYLGYLYADQNMNVERSFILIRKALEKDPGNGAYLDSLGWAYFRKGMYGEALAQLLEAERQLDIEHAPDSTVYDHIGDVYSKLGKHEQALKYWKKSLELENNLTIRAKVEGLDK
ncbi:MAG: tetratricopeptide repeat protein [Spirochaetia bacterium]|jgi:tetratricopeptide (TPR) repeat protein|nr:tetratricopeptide repeat protein [Spirochaetia bacterium]